MFSLCGEVLTVLFLQCFLSAESHSSIDVSCGSSHMPTLMAKGTAWGHTDELGWEFREDGKEACASNYVNCNALMLNAEPRLN